MRAGTYDIETELSDVTMADLIEEGAADVLVDYGLNCIGCHAALGEDIVEAARIHGLERNQAQQLISSVEDIVATSSATEGA